MESSKSITEPPSSNYNQPALNMSSQPTLSTHLATLTLSPPSTPTTFPLFAHLPTELRLQIWSHALPPPPRLLTLIIHITTSRVPTLTFTPTPLSYTLDYLPSSGLSSASPESRALYLYSYPATLPAPSGGIIHFSPTTIIRLSNYEELQRSLPFATAYKALPSPSALNNHSKLPFLSPITHLAVPFRCAFPSVERDAWSGSGGGPVVRLFGGVEVYYLLPRAEKAERKDYGRTMREWDEAERVRKRWRVFEEKIETGWRVPKVEILNLTIGAGEALW